MRIFLGNVYLTLKCMVGTWARKTFLENVYDDVVKPSFKHFASYIKMFDECFVNIVAVSSSLTNYMVIKLLLILHYENLSLKMTLKNHSYSEIQYYKRKCCTEKFSVLFQHCFCLT